MSTAKLRSWLLEQPDFQRQIDELVRSAIIADFPSIRPSSPNEDHDWRYLLLCASALARSDDTNEQRIALRVADTCLQLVTPTPEEKMAAGVILDTMANRRSLLLAEKRNFIPDDFAKSLPLPIRGDFLKREGEDSILTSSGFRFPVNRFQKDFWTALKEATWVSASAPTSAGKSFLLRAWIAEIFVNSPNAKVVFLVPTRALIQELSEAFGDDALSGHLPGVTLHTLPMEITEDKGGHLFIYTQERLHILLSRDKEAAFDAIIIDEAHKVGDGSRGVLLEQVIHECVRHSSKTQIIFASPHAENPGDLLTDCPQGLRSEPVKREVTTVSQNLLFVSQKPGKPLIWEIEYRDGDKRLLIGECDLLFRPTPASKRLSAVAFALGCESGNLVYANGQADAEKYANHLAEACEQARTPPLDLHPRISDLRKLIEKAIHKKYILLKTLRYGIAFHYGNMPLLVRLEIESLFRDNILRFLVCTSTLMEGVNLPCKAIFLRGPSRGRNNHINDSDFWNLAGRAGRWGTEFQGNIVCIDPYRKDVWKESPPTQKTKQRIQRATENAIEADNGLIDYAENGFQTADGGECIEFDYASSFFLSVLARHEKLDTIPTVARLKPELRQRLTAVLEQELEDFDLPLDFVFRNPGVLPRAMKKLQAHFNALSPEQFSVAVPVLPESQDAATRYKDIFRFINDHLRAHWAVLGEEGDRRLWQLAYLTVDWMRGRPLAYLISTREKISARHQNPPNTATVIRSVMSDVEVYARFNIPRYLRCYLDIQVEVAKKRQLDSLIENLPDLELWLELGVSVRSALSLMELGLSRTSAIELVEHMTATEFSKEQVLAWLRANDLDSLDIPNLVKEEVRRILERSTRR